MEYLQDGISDAQRELSSPLFDLTEPSHDILSSDSSSTIEKSLNDVLSSDSSPTIDIVQSFSPIPHSLTISAKFFLAFWVWASLGASIPYLTNWGWTVTCIYFVFSLLCAIVLKKWGEHNASIMLVKITWVRVLRWLIAAEHPIWSNSIHIIITFSNQSFSPGLVCNSVSS